MKWIGQHIVDLIARFRSSIYLEGVETGTIASGGNLGLDSDNKIVKDSGVGATDLHGAGVDGAANQLLTDDGDGTVTSESKLTFDGTDLEIGLGTANTVHDIKRTDRTNNGGGGGIHIISANAYGTDQTGGALHLYGGQGTGTGNGGAINLYVYPPTAGSDADLNTSAISWLFSGQDGSLQLAGDLHGKRDTDLKIKSEADLYFYIDSDDGAGTNGFKWYDYDTEIASLDKDGNFQIDGDLTLSGLDIKNADGEVVISLEADQDTVFFKDVFFGQDNTTATKMRRTPRSTAGDGGTFYINAGDAYGANNDGGNFQIVAGAGTGTGVGGDFQFLSFNASGSSNSTLNTALMMQPALLTQTGNLTIAGDLTITGGNITNAITFDAGITDAGTIAAGTWNGGVIASDKLDADTAHLTTAQTFTGSKTMGTTVKLNFRDANSYIYSPTANDLEIVATDIVLDAATSISLENDTTVTGNLTATRKYELPSDTVGTHSGGDVYYYGDGSTVKGGIYYINGTNWTLADADAEASTSGLLAVALGTDPDVDGMLLRGFVTLLTEVEGTEAIGSVVYLSATNAGKATITVPGSGDFVRVLGYSLHATENQVYFNPDNTWVEVA